MDDPRYEREASTEGQTNKKGRETRKEEAQREKRASGRKLAGAISVVVAQRFRNELLAGQNIHRGGFLNRCQRSDARERKRE